MYLKEVVQKELPNTKHALSIGLIASRFPSWFNAALGEHYNDWEYELYRLHNMESTMDFDLGWSDMVRCYGLDGNRHIASLFLSRNLWASPYLRGHFLAGLTALPGLSKIKDFIQRLLSAQTCLSRFIEQVTISSHVPVVIPFHINRLNANFSCPLYEKLLYPVTSHYCSS